MSQLLPRFFARSERVERDRRIALIVRESGDVVAPATVACATLPGDTRRLRGIPCIARGVGGTSPGSNPLAETIARDERRRG